MTAPQRILVVGPSWIGDMVMAQSLYISLRRRLPTARIDVMAPPGTATLLERMPEIDSAQVVDIGHGETAWSKRRQTARRLEAEGYDQAIVLQRSAKAALIPWLAGIPRRTGQLGELRFGLINDVRHLDTRRYPRKIEHYALLGLRADGDPLVDTPLPQLRIDTARREDLIDSLGLDTDRPVVGFAPGAAFGGAKQWPTSHYARLAGELDRHGIAVWIFGSAADREMTATLAAAAPRHGVNLCERTSLIDIVDLASRTDAFVGNDTGVMHLASASAPRVIAIYGSTHPDYAPPLAPLAASFWLGLSCAPCRQRQCPLGHTACMRDIPVADVLDFCLAPGERAVASLHYARGEALAIPTVPADTA